jgi:hypothetical protein
MSLHQFNVQIGTTFFRVIESPEPLSKPATIDYDERVIWLDPREPLDGRAALCAAAISAAWKRWTEQSRTPFDDAPHCPVCGRRYELWGAPLIRHIASKHRMNYAEAEKAMKALSATLVTRACV